jgi:hypothetical protein
MLPNKNKNDRSVLDLYIKLTLSKVSRAVDTILSAISTEGILPENDADVYPYVTLASNFNVSCFASNIRKRPYHKKERRQN